MFAAHIGFYYADGSEILLNNPVHLVDGSLHDAIKRADTADDLEKKKTQNRCCNQKDDGQLGIDKERSAQGSEHHDRRAKSRPHAGGDGVLDGGHVAGQTGHQGGFAEVVRVGEGELLKLCELLLADFRAYSLSAGRGKTGVTLA